LLIINKRRPWEADDDIFIMCLSFIIILPRYRIIHQQKKEEPKKAGKLESLWTEKPHTGKPSMLFISS
tara:strand:+ start:888 stop:1091 length:204 start_codon:yes stop_codon:yes gene_type:complete